MQGTNRAKGQSGTDAFEKFLNDQIGAAGETERDSAHVARLTSLKRKAVIPICSVLETLTKSTFSKLSYISSRDEVNYKILTPNSLPFFQGEDG